MKTQETLDAELIALAALAQAEAVCMAGDNQNRAYRAYRGEHAQWSSGGGYPPATTELYDLMYKRGYKL